ncbi:HD domain-containing protein [Floricoccus penangensis]|uniref:HD domain-containing protein n=1 Tax=Floricoccus penangensis TaxID=1859475 RepID=A0A9Q5JFX1_9LACT|nr:HD domain-containing protein [Floricoccus penangensis]OFI46618.1 hypothetical protein BG262_02100 [Floricoccus penangensis]URZ86838.1 HD domain-containing protein [Floricoccus penangensis]
MTFYDKPWEQDEEYLELISDLIDRPEVQKLDEIVHHHHTTRLIHSLNVSYNSYRIAKKFGMKSREVARAGLLHDLFYYDWRDTKFEEGSHAYVHPRIAYENALKLTELSELEKDIIIKHMWGATIAPPKYKESFVVTMVDKYCAIKESSTPVAYKWRAFRNRSAH